MIDHRFIKDLIDNVFIASGNAAMNTSELYDEIKKVTPEVSRKQVWQTLNDSRFVGHYVRILESAGRHLYQIEENCFRRVSRGTNPRAEQSLE